MNILAGLVLLSVALILTSCATFSDKQLNYPELEENVDFEWEFPPKLSLEYPEDLKTGEMLLESLGQYAEQYKTAKQECADESGKWVLVAHSHSTLTDRWTYHCRNCDPPSMSDCEQSSKRSSLLPYNLAVDFIRKTQRVVNFSRIYPNSDQNQHDIQERN
ncbi:MAG: hypothetical protein OXG24_02485 [Gammaproteobacteria bacterium]|nr:hypothetical protein [Gammaproteobacteria bacterium]